MDAPKFETVYSYDARGQVSALSNYWKDYPDNPGTFTLGSGFTNLFYDAAGNRLTERISAPAVGNAPDASRDRSFAYDSLDQLTGEMSVVTGSGSTLYNGGVASRTLGFAYDLAGNPTQFRGSGPNGFNPDDQILGTGFAFDGNGNPTTYSSSLPPGSVLAFDAENRLLPSASGKSFAADYDGDGLRTRKATSGGDRYFVRDGDAALLELDASGAVKSAYGWGAGLPAVPVRSGGPVLPLHLRPRGQPVPARQPGQRHHLRPEHLRLRRVRVSAGQGGGDEFGGAGEPAGRVRGAVGGLHGH